MKDRKWNKVSRSKNQCFSKVNIPKLFKEILFTSHSSRMINRQSTCQKLYLL